MKSLFLATCVCLAFSSQAAFPQADGVTRIRIDWGEVMDRVSPEPKNDIRVSRHVVVILKGRNQLEQQSSSVSGRDKRDVSKDTVLGGDEWRVGPNNTLVRNDEYPSHVRTVIVQVDNNSCTASIDFRLKGNYRYYQTDMLSRPGTTGTYSKIAISYSRCSIE